MKKEKRLIDANVLCDCFEKAAYKCEYIEDMVFHLDYILDEITGADEVDAVEVVHGHWTSTGIFSKRAGYGVRYYQHAECEVAPCRLFECEHNYCPNCGAKMDGGNEDG